VRTYPLETIIRGSVPAGTSPCRKTCPKVIGRLDDVPVVLANGVENTTHVIGVLPMKSVPMVSAETDPE
jgi:hypothetical protein